MKKFLYNSSLFLLLMFYSIQGYSQMDTIIKTSEHPLLDKYYPRPKEDTVARNPVIKSTGVSQKNVIATPKPQPKAIEEKRLTFPTPVRKEEIPVVDASPVQKDVTPAVSEMPVTTPVSTGIATSQTSAIAPLTDSTKIAKPVILSPATTPPPESKTSSPIKTIYRNRLGSSSPLYNTYEKNKNGAGSVTTLPKR